VVGFFRVLAFVIHVTGERRLKIGAPPADVVTFRPAATPIDLIRSDGVSPD
jgi:hypothetical protein